MKNRDYVLFAAIWCMLIALTHVIQMALIVGPIPNAIQVSMSMGWVIFSFLFATPTTLLVAKCKA